MKHRSYNACIVCNTVINVDVIFLRRT